jgi:hypothetical protein
MGDRAAAVEGVHRVAGAGAAHAHKVPGFGGREGELRAGRGESAVVKDAQGHGF